MKLYYGPGSCALSPHIVLREAGVRFDLVKVAMKTHTLADGSDFYAINPKGYVPVLELDNGQRLTEGTAIVQYIADHAPASGLAPPAGTMERYRLMEWLNFISTEVHKQFSPLFNAALSDEVKKIFADKIRSRLQWIDRQLAGCDYLMGERFCVADAYLFTVTGWAPRVGVPMDDFANLVAWRARVGARPAVQEAMQVENAK
ncbi:MAG TPA: glutathione transferase GstA [Burkholderiaceae bacterium]|nr:glutathione transferase GstA [Burkholderiaceae bacterium]